MKQILIAIGMYLIKQEWFQDSVVKMITNAAEMGAAASATTADDILIRIIKRNKVELLTIVEREAHLTETPFDDRLVQSIRDL